MVDFSPGRGTVKSSGGAGRGRRISEVAAGWLRNADQFEWLSGYLHARGLATATQRLMALMCLALVFMPIGLVGIPDHPDPALIALHACAGIVGVGYAVLWLRGWPTPRQSLTLILAGGLVTLGALWAADPITGLIGCTGLVVIGGYLAFFHSGRAMLGSVIVAVLAGAACAVRVVHAGLGSHIAVAGFWVVVEVTAAVPVAIYAVVRTLGADVVRSDHDALTGVLNRRAFYERATSLLSTPSPELRLIVIMVDLDNFKRLNDTYGHVAGDQALTAVGWALRQNSHSDTALIGRSGGEEFLLIDLVLAEEVEQLPKRLCEAISELPHRITASVGVAVTFYALVTNPVAAMDAMVHVADTAMYEAKRRGGNQVITKVRTMA
jgi:diguanylate cyclase